MPHRHISVILAALFPSSALLALSVSPPQPAPDRAQTVTTPPVLEPPPPPLIRRPAPVAIRTIGTASVRPSAPARPVRREISFQEQMLRAVAHIPGYQPGLTLWRVTPRYGHWGASDVWRHIVYISPNVPLDKLYSVVAHEWGHQLTVRAYGGDVSRAFDAMNSYYGGSGYLGAERAADCIARLLGATWTNYTFCTDARWRAGARRLLAGQPV